MANISFFSACCVLTSLQASLHVIRQQLQLSREDTLKTEYFYAIKNGGLITNWTEVNSKRTQIELSSSPVQYIFSTHNVLARAVRKRRSLFFYCCKRDLMPINCQ
jgi:hypothetical protein